MQYGTYDACIVAAESEEEAQTINPGGEWGDPLNTFWLDEPEDVVDVFLIGTAIQGTKKGVILASFKTGHLNYNLIAILKTSN